jgi:hypothetical protein
MREHAPGWTVETLEAPDGGILFKAPVGGYLMIRIKHSEGMRTPAVPQAIMDHRNNSIPFDKITSRDITDTHRRGACMALAMHFGLAYELWAKDPLESGYHGVTTARSAAAGQEVNSTAPENRTATLAARIKAKDIAANSAGQVAVAADDNRPVGDDDVMFAIIEKMKKARSDKGVDKIRADASKNFKWIRRHHKMLDESVKAAKTRIENKRKKKEGGSDVPDQEF